MSARLCTIEDCGRTYEARGWCSLHYNRWRRHGDPEYSRPVGRPRKDALGPRRDRWDGSGVAPAPTPCSTDGCGQDRITRELCWTCWLGTVHPELTEGTAADRVAALLLLAPEGLTANEVETYLGISASTARATFTQLQADGLVRSEKVERAGGAGGHEYAWHLVEGSC